MPRFQVHHIPGIIYPGISARYYQWYILLKVWDSSNTTHTECLGVDHSHGYLFIIFFSFFFKKRLTVWCNVIQPVDIVAFGHCVFTFEFEFINELWSFLPNCTSICCSSFVSPCFQSVCVCDKLCYLLISLVGVKNWWKLTDLF